MIADERMTEAYTRMKHINYYFIGILSLVVLSISFSSCKKDEPDFISVNPTSVSLVSTANSIATINVKANCDWQVGSYPEWINLSSTSGNGDTSITITALSDNMTASSRVGTIVFAAGELEAEIQITQVAGLQSDLEIEILDDVVLTESATFRLSFGSKVDYFIAGYFDASSAGWSDDRILNALDNNNAMQASEGKTLSCDGLSPNTTYIQVFVGYDSKGNRGELIRKKFTTPSYKNINDVPQANIDDVWYSSTLYGWGTYLNPAANSYYMISQTGETAMLMAYGFTRSDFAMLIKMMQNELTLYLNSYDDWRITRDANNYDLLISTWAKNNNEWGSVVDVYYGHVSSDSRTIRKQQSSRPMSLKKGCANEYKVHTSEEWKRILENTKLVRH
ncbi:MAG: BACON domain-containing protein [Muribaculaceae bacterium]|nr:BACON domain-containing protein [Muribaculaceae bacterium]